MGDYDHDAYTKAYLALNVIATAGALATCVVIFVKLKKTSGHARHAVQWLKATSTVLTISTLVILAFLVPSYVRPYYGVLPEGEDAIQYLSLIGLLLWQWTRAMIPVMLAVVGGAIHRSARGETAPRGRIVRSCALVFGAVCAVLAVVHFGIGIYYEVMRSSGTWNWPWEIFTHLARIQVASAILVFLASSLVAIWSFSIGSLNGLRSVKTRYIIATVLNVIGTAWIMIYRICINLAYVNIFDWARMLNIFLDTWAAIGILVLVFTVLKKEAGGDWSGGERSTKLGV